MIIIHICVDTCIYIVYPWSIHGIYIYIYNSLVNVYSIHMMGTLPTGWRKPIEKADVKQDLTISIRLWITITA